MDSNDFWDLLDRKYDPMITYNDWLHEQLQLILTHPAGHIFNVDSIPINQNKLSTDMENNFYWKLFTYLSSNSKYNVMIEVRMNYRIDRSTFTHTHWVNFSQFDDYLDKKCKSHYQLSLEKWFIKRV